MPGFLESVKTVLKYPGSKWNIARQLAELIPPHHSYVEPFFGSGALLFTKEPSDIETINDLDSDVINLFRCMQQGSGDDIYKGIFITTGISLPERLQVEHVSINRTPKKHAEKMI